MTLFSPFPHVRRLMAPSAFLAMRALWIESIRSDRHGLAILWFGRDAFPIGADAICVAACSSFGHLQWPMT